MSPRTRRDDLPHGPGGTHWYTNSPETSDISVCKHNDSGWRSSAFSTKLTPYEAEEWARRLTDADRMGVKDGRQQIRDVIMQD